MRGLSKEIKKLAQVNIFERDKDGTPKAGIFVGRPFYLDFERCNILVADAWKQKAKGLPQGCFLLAYYENEKDVSEAILLRVLKPCTLPTDSGVISSMIEYYKDNLKTAGEQDNLDTYTRYEFSFSGIECRALGTFYKDSNDKVHFGADVENFYSAHNYRIFKPSPEVLSLLVNYAEDQITGTPTQIKVGRVRYSSSTRFQANEEDVPVYVTPNDFLGRRTALFGMTRTGKSNTVKKIIQATVEMSAQAPKKKVPDAPPKNIDEALNPYTDEGKPKYPVGQIIFDVNGEYANPNMQDDGTAIFEIFQEITERYSVLEKPNFKVMRANFYHDIRTGFELVRSYLDADGGDYVKSFSAVDMVEPEDSNKLGSEWTRYDRVRAAYLCCLYKANFPISEDFTVTFRGAAEINQMVQNGEIVPDNGISLEQACTWFEKVWENYNSFEYFQDYRSKKGREWADEDLKSILVFLSCSRTPNGNKTLSGYRKLRPLIGQHTETVENPFREEIIKELRQGKIVIVDLSQGNEQIQKMYSEMLCQEIFHDSMARFTKNIPNNFIQFYFEEAHNLFPKKDDKDYQQIYNRIAKEGAKLSIGLTYATQEASSISSNILKNTQNWFIAHLNNVDEIKEIRKFYDFSDFADGLIRFSAENDKGFIRMKTYSNPFVVPVQVDRFQRDKK